MTRGVDKPEVPPVPRDQLPADVQAEIAPFETVLAANAKDQAALVGEATMFENHNLIANALEVYYKLRAQWPDAVWVKSKIFDLEQTLAAQARLAARRGPPAARPTRCWWVSRNTKSRSCRCSSRDEDANVFDQLLESPLGGGVAARQLLLLTE